jgi:hypothetical protein
MLMVQESSRCHISHYFNLVSAYELCPERLDDLIKDIEEAQKKAKETYESIVVEQDCHEHILLVHPSGRVSLYACMGLFDIVKE